MYISYTNDDNNKKYKETSYAKTKINYLNKKPETKLNFTNKINLIKNTSPDVKKKRLDDFPERKSDDWLELRGIDFEQWRKLSHQKFVFEQQQQQQQQQRTSNSPNLDVKKTEMTQTESPKNKQESYCENLSRGSIELRRIQLGGDIRSKSPIRTRSPDRLRERSKSPTQQPSPSIIDVKNGKSSPEMKNYRCSKSRSRSPSPRSKSPQPSSTPNPMYTSFTISSILRRTDSSAKKNSSSGSSSSSYGSGNVQQNFVLDAATNFLTHHPACTDPTMLSR